MIPDDVSLPECREKMPGTGHALYCAANLIEGDFVVINADDFYGFDSYRIAAKFFEENLNNATYLRVNYPCYVTASKTFGFKFIKYIEMFGLEEITKNGLEIKIIETSVKNSNNKALSFALV